MNNVKRRTVSARSLMQAIDRKPSTYVTYPFSGRSFTKRDVPGADPGTGGRIYPGPGVKP